MCGIVGFIEHKKKSDLSILKQMTDKMTARGPDDSGYSLVQSDDTQIGLGHRRLSILDLSSHGHQPMDFDDYYLVYNGEVYNFRDIRKELEEYGYSFESDSDTEVVLKAFHKWGIESVHKFRGMFSFCIVDKKNQKSYLFRDRAGVKPLYYYTDENGLFIYGSELKAFYEHLEFQKVLDKDSLALYLQFGYIPAPFTIFKNTFKLNAGHYIEYDLKKQSFKEKKYWDVLENYRREKSGLSENEVLEELESILTEAFSLRMIADVPVGIFLSGGIDSTLVTAILQKNATQPISTFTIGFQEDGYNEAQYAKEIATHLGTDHAELYCSTEDIMDVIYELPDIYDEPFADDAAIPTILISRFAKDKVSVVLSGDGGDETFCGYSKYFALNKIANLAKRGMKKNILNIMLSSINEDFLVKINTILPDSIKQRNIKEKYKKFKRALSSNNFSEMFINASSPVDPKRVNLILKNTNSQIEKTAFSEFYDIKDFSVLEQMMVIDYKTYLVDEVLTKVDKATMSVSLEGREPLLDHKIIEFMAEIPIDLKYKQGTGKFLAKELLYRYIPKEMLNRPKTGFQLPLQEWLKGDLRELVDTYLSKEKLDEDGLFDSNEVLKNLENYYNGKTANINEIWHILNFQMWKEKWL